jgi:hypothetical protein
MMRRAKKKQMEEAMMVAVEMSGWMGRYWRGLGGDRLRLH